MLPVLWVTLGVAIFMLAVHLIGKVGAEPLHPLRSTLEIQLGGRERSAENQDPSATPDVASCSISGTYPGYQRCHQLYRPGGLHRSPRWGQRDPCLPFTPFTSTLVIMQPLLTLLSIPFILASVPVRPSRQD